MINCYAIKEKNKWVHKCKDDVCECFDVFNLKSYKTEPTKVMQESWKVKL